MNTPIDEDTVHNIIILVDGEGEGEGDENQDGEYYEDEGN